MLAKKPQQNLRNNNSLVHNKLVIMLVILIMGLGFTAAYTMMPLLQTTEPVYLTSNITNTTPMHTPAVNIKKAAAQYHQVTK